MAWTPPGTDPAPDAALTRRFSGCLPGGRFAGPLLAFRTVPSTQSVLRSLAAAGAPEGTVVVADHQTAGRGRRGRTWIDPPGTAVLVSSLLRPPVEPARWPQLPLVTGCAVAEAIETLTGLTTRLKWPNDVLVGGRKVAGLLAEGVPGPLPFVVLGIGLNVLQRTEDWPPELAGAAASLAELGAVVEREALLAEILRALAAHYGEWVQHGFEPARTAWCRRGLLGPGAPSPDGEGSPVDLAPNGGLVVRRADGTTGTIASADPAPAGLILPSAP